MVISNFVLEVWRSTEELCSTMKSTLGVLDVGGVKEGWETRDEKDVVIYSENEIRISRGPAPTRVFLCHEALTNTYLNLIYL